ncbi:4-alpha-glucanotransferase [Magnetospirillum moscoviense]|uniref:4-alpha-glucanotransferase n=1 Tax=Magnetospirillum moscoviense TaxID=1437059 RepID=A0A178MJW3_9PROT|nr:4-alpha-glucanotransferase [Magnetospirillum moscoviense]OAN48889.1 4-alpha-glucanotransferase [Magnetospirillum moscoviense]
MSETEMLDRLARFAGIEDGWWDFYGQWRVVPASTKRAFLAAMGLDAADESQAAATLAQLEDRPWRRWLEPVALFTAGQADPFVTLTVPADLDKVTAGWTLTEEMGVGHSAFVTIDTQEWIDERWVDGELVKRWKLRLPELPPPGYHRLSVEIGTETAEMAVIVAPAKGHVPPEVAGGARAWGLATQIYALRTGSDWGVGHYGALAELGQMAGRLGAKTIGVNPLHALFPNCAERYSPYAPSSRRFLNVTYLDIEAIPEFRHCREAKRTFASPGFQATLARVKGYPLVDYAEVARVQRPVLEALYAWFCSEHLAENDERAQAFRAFQQTGGAALAQFATFEALHERFLKDGNGWWRHWPEEFRHPANPAVARFAADNSERVQFYAWLQFEADRQLGAAHQAARDAGATIGLYRDLGVGIAGDGADSWGDQDLLALGLSVGAPPDPLALKGQDWGLLPFNPIALREAAYRPFAEILAANMRHAGALRLDHAMLLQRLYWVPPGVDADQGAYVRYPVDDLFRLVALESARNRCLVIGEDLGTVPDGFRERMDAASLFAYRVMVFEKTDGRFKRPDEFSPQALAIFATHDLPSILGWWNEADIKARARLNLYPRDGMAAEEQDARAADRRLMVEALAGQGLLPPDFPTSGPLDAAQGQALTAAGHHYLARSSAALMMVQIEDVLAEDSQMNLPGTVDQHPNWRRRFALDVAGLDGDARMKALGNLRPSPKVP